MKYLLDTCVLSELVRPRPALSVVTWVRQQTEDALCLSVLTLGEIQKGVARLDDGARKRQLAHWLEHELRPRFASRWLAVDEETALRWGRLGAELEQRGHRLPVVDGLLAATALVHGLIVVTRNTADMAPTGALTLNPWTV